MLYIGKETHTHNIVIHLHTPIQIILGNKQKERKKMPTPVPFSTDALSCRQISGARAGRGRGWEALCPRERKRVSRPAWPAIRSWTGAPATSSPARGLRVLQRKRARCAPTVQPLRWESARRPRGSCLRLLSLGSPQLRGQHTAQRMVSRTEMCPRKEP